MTAIRSSLAVAILLVSAAYLRANDPPDLTEGFTPPEVSAGTIVGSYPLSNVDSVNPYSGRVGFSIPVRSIGGRGNVGHSIVVSPGRVWKVGSTDNCPSGNTNCGGRTVWENPEPSATNSSNYEIGYGPGFVEVRQAVTWDETNCTTTGGKLENTLTRVIFHTPGGEVILTDTDTNGEPFVPVAGCYDNYYTYNNTAARTRGTVFTSDDGSNIMFVSDAALLDDRDIGYPEASGILYFPNGTKYEIDDGRIKKMTDRNGNELVLEYHDGSCHYCPTKFKDPLLRETTVTYGAACTGFNYCDTITWSGAAGATRTVTVRYDDLADVLETGSVDTYSNLFPDLNTSVAGNYTDVVVAEVEIPDGREYKLEYNKYGEVVKMILPTEARIEYDWIDGFNGDATGGANTAKNVVLRRVSQRRTYLDDTTSTYENRTDYSYSELANCSPLSTGIGFKSVVKQWDSDSSSYESESATYYCGMPGKNGYTGPAHYASWKNGRSYKTEQLDSTTVLRAQLITWGQNVPSGLDWWPGPDDGDSAPVQYSRVDSTEVTEGSLTLKREYKYDDYNNRTDVFEYDWNGTTPARRTHTNYKDDPPSYLAAPIYLLSLPVEVFICGSGSSDCDDSQDVAKTEFVYDTGDIEDRSSPAASGHDSSNYSTTYATRGNLTKVRRYLDTASAWVESVVKYDILGNPVQATDPLGNQTTLSYDDDFSTGSVPGSEESYAFATTATRPLAQSVSTKYDYHLGRPTQYTDLNGVKSTFEYDDSLDRFTKAISADDPATAALKTQTRFSYDDTNRIITTYRDQYAFDDENFHTKAFYDTLGRTIAARDQECVMTVTTYDKLGRQKTVSNPKTHGSGSCSAPSTFPGSVPVTLRKYDKLGRVEEIEQTGNADTDMDYPAANYSEVTDPAGKKRRLTYDGLGRLVEVREDPSGSLNYITEYTYNELDKLTEVKQKGTGGSGTQQTRTFTYDSLGRMLSADNPEDSGDIDYAYDGNGNLLRKVDARGVAKCHYSNQTCSAAGALGSNGYDALNRPTVVTYSDSTPTEYYCYDGKNFDYGTSSCVTPGSPLPYSVGRFTLSSNGYTHQQVHAYDAKGRILDYDQTIVVADSPWTPVTHSFAYEYNRDGTLKSETYPSGKKIDHVYGDDGRVWSTQLDGASSYYIAQSYYTDHGAIDALVYGSNLVEQRCYNDRLQPTEMRLGAAWQVACANQTTDKIHLSFDFGTASSNNGNMLEQTIWAPDNGSGSPWEVMQTYTYDAVNRLDTATEKKSAVTQWSRGYDYDHFGNRWISAATGHTLHMATPTSSSAIQATTNKLTGTGITYDNAGNMTAHPQITPGSGSMSYDANNKMTAFTATGVAVNTIYDATGKRVRKIYNGETTVWVYDAFGRLAAEYTTATQYEAAGTYYRTTDHLGSTRLVTDSSGAVKQRRDFFPFGEQIDDTLSSRSGVSDGGVDTYNASSRVKQQFTGHERDDETELDYMKARNYQPCLARFLSVDPGAKGTRLTNPQSLNAYTYALNRPLSLVDPDGKDPNQCSPPAAFIPIDPVSACNYWGDDPDPGGFVDFCMESTRQVNDFHFLLSGVST